MSAKQTAPEAKRGRSFTLHVLSVAAATTHCDFAAVSPNMPSDDGTMRGAVRAPATMPDTAAINRAILAAVNVTGHGTVHAHRLVTLG